MRKLSCSAVVTAMILIASCRAPTQVRVIVRSDACTTTSSTAITVGYLGDIETKPPGPTSSRCSDGEVGSLVIQPSDEKDATFAFKVVMGIAKAADQCVAPLYEGCIVARRALSFLPNEDLEVVVDMRASCTDRPCTPDLTCVNGSCVTAQIDLSKCLPSCTEASLGGGGSGATDAGTVDGGGAESVKDASSDGSPPTACLPHNAVCPAGSATTACCPGMSCMGSSFGWRCCSGGPCKVGAGDCCELETCVFDGTRGVCLPR